MAPWLTVMTVDSPGAPLTACTRLAEQPPRGCVRIDVVASGVCHADISTAAARGPSAMFPVTPGHEIAGFLADIGDGVEGWRVGDRVCVGWFGGSCGHCDMCRDGDVHHCAQRKVPGLSYPGGWAQAVTVPADALCRVPEGMSLFDAAPMGCAGVATFNAIRSANLTAGATVAVFGIGGLGHLALQFSAAMGYRTIAIARGPDREPLARDLGAHEYIDSVQGHAGAALAEFGGADLIVSTASSTAHVAGLLTGLRVRGQLTLVGVDSGLIELPVGRLVMRSQKVAGHLTGSARDTETAMRFARANNVRPMIERMPLTEVSDALTRVASGTARFRIVLETGVRQ